MYSENMISIEALKKFIQEHEDEIICIGCGKPLSSAPWEVKSYPHDGGLPVLEYNGQKRWVYIEHHDHCNYQMALWKMENRMINTNRDLFRKYVETVYVDEVGKNDKV